MLFCYFSCHLCDGDYVGNTTRRLFQRVAEHKYSAIGKHLTEVLSVTNVLSESCFKVFKKCHLAFEMPHINRLKQGKKVVFTRSQNDRLQLSNAVFCVHSLALFDRKIRGFPFVFQTANSSFVLSSDSFPPR